MPLMNKACVSPFYLGEVSMKLSSALFVLSLPLLVAACSDSGSDKKAEAPAKPAATAPAKPASAPSAPSAAAEARQKLNAMKPDYDRLRTAWIAVRDPYRAKLKARDAAKTANRTVEEQAASAELAKMRPSYIAARDAWNKISGQWKTLKKTVKAGG